MNDYKQIRQRYLNGESQRSIAKSMGISRNTVKKYCEGENVPWERKTPEREASVLTEDVLALSLIHISRTAFCYWRTITVFPATI